jgi:hypothetical protein
MKSELMTYTNVRLSRTTLKLVSREREKNIILAIDEVPLEDGIPVDIPARTHIFAKDPRISIYVSDAYLATTELISAKKTVITCLWGEEMIFFVYNPPAFR